MTTPDPATLTQFWQAARAAVPDLTPSPPAAWAFGATPEHADSLLALVIEGRKTATASSMWDYESSGEPLPVVGEFSVILDGQARPRVVLRTTALEVVRFDAVTAEHAHAEGEGDRTLQYWRAVHEWFWREHSEDPRGFAPDMPVLCEQFELLYVAP